MPRSNFIQAPTLRQYVSVFNAVRKVRKTVAKGEMTPDDAVELRHLMDVMENEFQLSCGNDNDTREQAAVREAINAEESLPGRCQ